MMSGRVRAIVLIASLSVALTLSLRCASADDASSRPTLDAVELRWGVVIPMRDGVQLQAIAYLPKGQREPAPCLVALSPYTAQRNHDRASYFAARGLPFLAVDVRGRGDSQGEFRPFLQESDDGYDVVEWLATQPYCNGKVAMFSSSYEGYAQWATARTFPPHLTTIAPVASVSPGVDFPMARNVPYPYSLRWLVLTRGRALQDRVFADEDFWMTKHRQWFESGRSFAEFDAVVGQASKVFQEWLAHPEQGAYWDAYRPTAEQYRRLQIPILTITGLYDGNQLGALSYYREHMREAPAAARNKHYLVIGPWDHSGTIQPRAEVGGLTFGPDALLDILGLHADWYAWTMQGKPKPQFLRKAVAYYVTGAERWQYADTLDAVTDHSRRYFLASSSNPTDAFASGELSEQTSRGLPDGYVYDPRDLSNAVLESQPSVLGLRDQRESLAGRGKQLVYHTAPFDQDTQISGFFRLSAWLSIDRPDTDFKAVVYEIGADGGSVLLAQDLLRARYRESLRQPRLIATKAPLQYDFDGFNFVSHQIKRGSRLRLVVGPNNSMFRQKNYNSGGEVAKESMREARAVSVRLYHDAAHPSALFVPFGRPADSIRAADGR